MNPDTNSLPSPDDLDGWKAASHALAQRFAHRVRSRGLNTSGALKQYFGCKNGEYFLEKYDRMGVTQAFVEWLVQDYRPIFPGKSKVRGGKSRKRRSRAKVRRGKTQAEKMLAAGLPAAEQKLLESRLQAHPTFFRAVGVEAGVSLTVEDILLGGKLTIHDRLLSGCVREGHYLVGRAFRAGGFHFFSPVGPLLPPWWAMDAVEFLERNDMRLTREGLIRDVHKFGWLWDWMDERAKEGDRPHLCNTDGDDLVWHTASFSVSDENAVRDALSKRDDIDYDEENDEYMWFRYQGDDAMIPGDTLNLGSLNFVLGELVLQVNSSRRLEAAGKWLEKLPGVRYLAAKKRDFNEDPRETPMDDKMGPKESVEMTPEVVSYVSEMMHQHYMKWLDTSLPMLGGKTPRQMCRTKAGRKKVAMLIRTIPTPVGNAGVDVDVPRQEMLRELGLESE